MEVVRGLMVGVLRTVSRLWRWMFGQGNAKTAGRPQKRRRRLGDRYVDPYDPEDADPDKEKKGWKQIDTEFRIAYLAIQSHLNEHMAYLKNHLEVAHDKDMDMEIRWVREEMYRAYEVKEIIPLEQVFDSKNWHPNVVESRKRYDKLVEEGQALGPKQREYFAKVAAMVELYKKLHVGLNQELSELQEAKRIQQVNYGARIEELKRTLKALELDSWQESEEDQIMFKDLIKDKH